MPSTLKLRVAVSVPLLPSLMVYVMVGTLPPWYEERGVNVKLPFVFKTMLPTPATVLLELPAEYVVPFTVN